MSESIDRRVVEMRFDNKDFENNVNTTMTVLEKLKEKLSFKGAGEKFESMSGLSGAIDGVKSRFSALEVVGMTALVNLTNSAVNLGKQMAKSLTVDQVKAGFSEYELKMGSIQTIMASTGADIATVNQKLNELNTYSDKTIYSFSDMTQSIGKFTNAGVDLNTAVAAIQGISNEAAVSGANAQEASRAMYNFAQALSAGYVKLIDWKSIENANMATKEFKQQLIDTAVAEGTLEKQADGTYKVLTQGANGAYKDSITATKNFNDSLSAAWMTTDVLTKTLGRYADASTDIGKKAFAAAQDVKTFSQLVDTVKESIGSGWAQTFEILFGNLEEAKELWTGVNAVISGFVDKVSSARNDLLQGWKDLGGRNDIINAFSNLYKAFSSILAPIQAAFRNVFPPATAKQLKSVSERFSEFTEKLIIGQKKFAQISNIFTALFSVLKFGLTIVKSVAGVFGTLAKVLVPVFDAILSGAASLSTCFLRLYDGTSDAASGMKEFVSAVTGKTSSGIDKLSSGLSSLTDTLAKLTGGLLGKAASGIGKIFSLLGEGLSHLNLAKVGGLLAGGGIMTAALKIAKVADTVKEKLEGLFGKEGEKKGGLKAKIEDTLDGLSDTLNQFQSSLKVGQLVTIAISLGILAASCATLADIPAKKLATAVAAIGGLFTELGIASHLMKGAQTEGIIKMSIAVVILASAVKKMSEIESMGKGLIGVGVILGELTAFCLIFDRLKIKPEALNKTSSGLILMAIAINLLAKPVKELGAMDVGSLIKGLGAVAAMLTGFTLTAKAFTKIETKGLGKAGAAMVVMAVAIRMLAKPLAQLGGMDMKSLAKGLGGMAVALGELVGFTAVMGQVAKSSGNIMKASAALLVMSVGIKIMAGAINQMGADSNVGQGLSAMFGALVILAGAMALMQNSLAGAAAMIIVAGALAIMAPAIAVLSSLNIGGVATGLFALAGTLALFGVGAALLAPVIPLMIALAAAMALLGVGVLSLGAGMTLLVAAFSMATGPIVEGATAISQAFPIIAQGIGTGIVTIIQTIGNSAEAIKTAFLQILDAIISVLLTAVPRIAEVGLQLILALMIGIQQNIGQITTVALNIIVNFVDAIAANIGTVVESGTNLIVQFVQGMADSLAQHGPELVTAMQSLMLALLETLVSAIPGIGKAGAKAIEKYRKNLETGGKKAEKSAKKTGKSVEKGLDVDPKQVSKGTSKSMDSFTKELDKAGKKSKTSSENASKNVRDGLKKYMSQSTGIGQNTGQGYVNGLNAKVDDAYRAGYAVGAAGARGEKDGAGVHSPSWKGFETGMYLVAGFINGMLGSSKKANKTANNIATQVVGSYNSALKSLDTISGTTFNSSITKVSEVKLRMVGVEKENARLAHGLDQLTKTLGDVTDTMNSRQMVNNINIEGSEDPNAFADALTRRMRLNARTL